MTRAIALLLLGVALQQSASPFAGFGVVGDSGFVPDGATSAWRLKTGETLAAGTRVWLLTVAEQRRAAGGATGARRWGRR